MSTEKKDVMFGKYAKDKITGFAGIVSAKCEYMYGCNQYCLTPKVDKEGKRQNMEWFDEGRIEVINEGIDPDTVKVKENGCECREHPAGR